MGRKHPDFHHPPPHPILAVTAGQMWALGWTVRACCPRCHVVTTVDLDTVIRLRGRDTVMWGQRPRCKAWINDGNARCPGRVYLQACVVLGGSWVRLDANPDVDGVIALMSEGPDMCNNYRLHVPPNQLAMPFQNAGRPLAMLGLTNEPGREYRIGDHAPVVTMEQDQPLLSLVKWAWTGPGGRPVFNFRSDGRDFSRSTRCLIPADGFFEFTDPKIKGRKTRWLFQMVDQPWFWIAGVIRDGSFAMLTTAPGEDIRPYHDRQVVVLPPGCGLHWLDLTTDPSMILAPSLPGSLSVTRDYPPETA